MVSQENSTGRPLADEKWLLIHHKAKLRERKAFAEKIAVINPKSIVDLGCASGLWLDILNQYLPKDCEFIGIDSDEQLLDSSRLKSRFWERKSVFLNLDLENDADKIPHSDLTLAFNVFPYIKNLDGFIEALSRRTPKGMLAVRQYDGASIRFGPLTTKKRQEIDNELRVALEHSRKFNHYDMDRTISALNNSAFVFVEKNFELFERFYPFTNEEFDYYKEMLLWTSQFLSEINSDYLMDWVSGIAQRKDGYIYEVDYSAILS
jgi:SAM-dependent methyltransferase